MKRKKPKETSKDVVAERIARLKEIVPEAFADGKIDFDALKSALGEEVYSSKARYSFSWNRKEEARARAFRPSTGTLRPCVAESVGRNGASGVFDSDNLYVEGDNLEVLKLLQKQYSGQVTMIYIDPPYNTGHGFVYADDFSDSVARYKAKTGQAGGDGRDASAAAELRGRYHTNWLNMMYPRLLLARNLLRDEGTIFISIDDNEVANLRMLCDEVFGEENRVNAFCWLNNLKGRQIASRGAAATYETVLCYAKKIEAVGEFATDGKWLRTRMPTAYRTKEYEVLKDSSGEYVLKNELYNTNSAFNEETRPTLVYKIFYNPENGQVKTGDLSEPCPRRYVEILPHANRDGVHAYHAWRWSRSKVRSDRRDLAFVADGGTYRIYTKVRDHARMAVKDVITDIPTGDLSRLFGRKVFDFAKPCELIELLLRCAAADGLVLDFFSGSATTAHAVMKLNAEDGGRRRFIMVQIPERTYEVRNGRKTALRCSKAAFDAGFETICEIGRERIRRAGRLLADETAAPGLDIGFRAFKLDSQCTVEV